MYAKARFVYRVVMACLVIINWCQMSLLQNLNINYSPSLAGSGAKRGELQLYDGDGGVRGGRGGPVHQLYHALYRGGHGGRGNRAAASGRLPQGT